MPYRGKWIYERKSREEKSLTGEGWDGFARQDWQFVTEENKHQIGKIITERLGDEEVKVLDLASGSWWYVPTHTAVDDSQEMLLRNPAPHRLLFNLDKLAEGYLLPLQDKFDAVLLCFGYNYIKDQNAVFKEAERLLRPEGKIFVAGGVSGGCPDFTLRNFDAEKIQVELEKLGLETIIHNVISTSGSPEEFKVVEAARCIPEKEELIKENIARVQLALENIRKEAREDYAAAIEERKTADADLVTQEEINSRPELEAPRQAGEQLEEKFGIQIFIIPHEPLKKDFKPEALRSSYAGLVLMGEKLADNNEEFISQIREEAEKLLQNHVQISGIFYIGSIEKMAEYLNREFQRTGKIRHIFAMSPHILPHSSLYGDFQGFWKQVFEKTSVPERIIERDLQRARRNDEHIIRNTRSRLQATRKFMKIVKEKGYL